MHFRSQNSNYATIRDVGEFSHVLLKGSEVKNNGVEVKGQSKQSKFKPE